MKGLYFLIFFTALFLAGSAKAQHITIIQQGTQTNIRGLSVVNDKIAWISGSKGYVALTVNSGKTWTWQQIKGFEKADFRGIEAFSDKEAIIMSSGTPALLLKTTDGGINWQIKYQTTDTSYFFDAISFANHKHGFVLGDPINGKFLLLETKDGGNTWLKYPYCPIALKDEAAFAASNTCLRFTDNEIYIVTGGRFAEFKMSKINSPIWLQYPIPILKGTASKGAFSIAVNKHQLVIVGGDYQHDKRSDSIACYSTCDGVSWQPSSSFPSGYQSCVEHINHNTFLSTGTSGTNISIDGGKTWNKIDAGSYNVCKKAKQGNLILLAGSNGKIAILKP